MVPPQIPPSMCLSVHRGLQCSVFGDLTSIHHGCISHNYLLTMIRYPYSCEFPLLFAVKPIDANALPFLPSPLDLPIRKLSAKGEMNRMTAGKNPAFSGSHSFGRFVDCLALSR